MPPKTHGQEITPDVLVARPSVPAAAHAGRAVPRLTFLLQSRLECVCYTPFPPRSPAVRGITASNGPRLGEETGAIRGRVILPSSAHPSCLPKINMQTDRCSPLPIFLCVIPSLSPDSQKLKLATFLETKIFSLSLDIQSTANRLPIEFDSFSKPGNSSFSLT